MSHCRFHEETDFLLYVSFPFPFLNFSLFCFWEEGLQGQRVDTKGREINGMEIKDTKNKLLKSL